MFDFKVFFRKIEKIFLLESSLLRQIQRGKFGGKLTKRESNKTKEVNGKK